MYKRMLIPLDGSEIAEMVFPYAKELAGRLGLDITFLYVCNRHEWESFAIYKAYVDHVAEKIMSRARQVQEVAGIQSQDQQVKIEGEVVVGHPAEEILRYTDEKDIDLILMVTHGRSGIKRWALGSVADKVLRSSTVPVWLLRAADSYDITDGEGQISKIIVPLDGSELSETVLPHVEMLVKQWRVLLEDVVLLMVCEPLVIPSVSAPNMEVPVNFGYLVEEHMTYAKKTANNYLIGAAAKLEHADPKIKIEVMEGSPAEKIIDYANENPCSLIAMATHGRSGIGRWVYGSVAEKVLSGASCPVFLVRPSSENALPLMKTTVGTVRSASPL